MPTAVVESKANRGSVETVIDEWESANGSASINQINSTRIGPNRIVHTLVYTTA